jgi:glutamate/tyrosine decarboxylase-like PLP-dependent enzyme
MAQEFQRQSERTELEMPPPMAFLDEGLPEEEVLEGVAERIDADPFDIERNFGISYVGPPHAISAKAADLAKGTVFVEWAREMFPGPYRLEKEAVRMMASLFGAPDGVGFITSGGTESNMSALRLARDRAGKSRPEVPRSRDGSRDLILAFDSGSGDRRFESFLASQTTTSRRARRMTTVLTR